MQVLEQKRATRDRNAACRGRISHRSVCLRTSWIPGGPSA